MILIPFLATGEVMEGYLARKAAAEPSAYEKKPLFFDMEVIFSKVKSVEISSLLLEKNVKIMGRSSSILA